MELNVNGESIQLEDTATITDLLAAMDLSEKPVAVEVNRAIIPRSMHAGHQLQPDDQIEIVHAIGGG